MFDEFIDSLIKEINHFDSTNIDDLSKILEDKYNSLQDNIDKLSKIIEEQFGKDV